MNFRETTRCKEHRRSDKSWRYSGPRDIQVTLSAGIWPSTDINRETAHDLDITSRCFPESTIRYNSSLKLLSVTFWTDNTFVYITLVEMRDSTSLVKNILTTYSYLVIRVREYESLLTIRPKKQPT